MSPRFLFPLFCSVLTAFSGASAQGSALVSAAQTAINLKYQGRACTQVELGSYAQGLSPTVTYVKGVYLTERKLASQHEQKAYGTVYTSFNYRTDIPESAGKGFYLRTPEGLVYCFGHWTVTAAKPTTGFQPAVGTQAVEATVVLTGAPTWVTTDRKAAVLAEFNGRDDRSELIALNTYDQGVAASLTKPNRVWLQIPK